MKTRVIYISIPGNMILKITVLILFVFCVGGNSYGQETERLGWLFWSHEQKLSNKWQLSSDIQLRSSNNFKSAEVLLLRPGIGYKITGEQTATAGYTFFGRWDAETGIKSYEPEHRIFEQYEIRHQIKKTEVNHRIRLEQRFLDQNVFAQRLRYYVQGKIPFQVDNTFKKGIYASVQNEIFLNVQNKAEVNQSFFEQNRAYLGFGFKFNDQCDLALGYMLLYQVKEKINNRSHIVQLSLKTSL